jgi:hypothetical protein
VNLRAVGFGTRLSEETDRSASREPALPEPPARQRLDAKVDRVAKREAIRRLRERATRYRDIARTFGDTQTINALHAIADELDLRADQLEVELSLDGHG